MISLKKLLTKILVLLKTLDTNVGAYYATNEVTVSVPSSNDQHTKGASQALPAGTYVVYGKAVFEKNTSGDRLISISTKEYIDTNYFDVQNASTMARTGMTAVRVYKLASNATVSLYARQNSGSSLSCITQIVAIRIR